MLHLNLYNLSCALNVPLYEQIVLFLEHCQGGICCTKYGKSTSIAGGMIIMQNAASNIIWNLPNSPINGKTSSILSMLVSSSGVSTFNFSMCLVSFVAFSLDKTSFRLS